VPSAVDLTAGVGFIQGGAPYGAIDARRAVNPLAREGVVGDTDLKVT
jgi:hypothetical protein